MTGSSGDRDRYAAVAVGRLWPIATSRAALFLCLWLVLAGANPGDLPAATAAIAAATWTSLHLLEPSSSRRSPRAIARLALLFLYHSVVAGVDVAGRALNPRLPLQQRRDPAKVIVCEREILRAEPPIGFTLRQRLRHDIHAASRRVLGRISSSAIRLIMRPSMASTPRTNVFAISEATSGVG